MVRTVPKSDRKTKNSTLSEQFQKSKRKFVETEYNMKLH